MIIFADIFFYIFQSLTSLTLCCRTRPNYRRGSAAAARTRRGCPCTCWRGRPRFASFWWQTYHGNRNANTTAMERAYYTTVMAMPGYGNGNVPAEASACTPTRSAIRACTRHRRAGSPTYKMCALYFTISIF